MRKRTFLPAIILVSLIFNQVVATVAFAQHHNEMLQTSGIDAAMPGMGDADEHSYDAHGSDHTNKHSNKDAPPLSCHCPLFSMGCSAGICATLATLGSPVYTLIQPSFVNNVGLRGRTVDVVLRPPRYIS